MTNNWQSLWHGIRTDKEYGMTLQLTQVMVSFSGRIEFSVEHAALASCLPSQQSFFGLTNHRRQIPWISVTGVQAEEKPIVKKTEFLQAPVSSSFDEHIFSTVKIALT